MSKWWAGIVLGLGLIASGFVFIACYPHDCKPNDTSCLPCPDPRSTNPACAPAWEPIPVEAQKPDGGSR